MNWSELTLTNRSGTLRTALLSSYITLIVCHKCKKYYSQEEVNNLTTFGFLFIGRSTEQTPMLYHLKFLH